MMCPKCHLEHPPEAQQCYCGWDFASGQLEASDLVAKKGAPQGPLRVEGWLLFPAIGLGIGMLLAFGAVAQSLLAGQVGGAVLLVLVAALVAKAVVMFCREHR